MKNQKCSNNCVVFKGSDCNNEMLDHVSSFKGEPKKAKKKNVENILYSIAHKGSGIDSYVVLINLPQWRSVVKLLENGAGIISLNTYSTVMWIKIKKFLNKFILVVEEFILKILRNKWVLVINYNFVIKTRNET